MNDFPHPFINPWTLIYPKEAAIIGRIVIAFSELEVQLSLMAASHVGPYEVMLRMLYTPRQSGFRIEAALAALKLLCRGLGVEAELDRAEKVVYECRSIRNRYAHCNWGGDQSGKEGLFFVDYQDSAQDPTVFTSMWKHVDVPLLEQQETFFAFANGLLIWLNEEIKCRKSGRRNLFPRREPVPLPPAHNPEEDHIPPWVYGEQREQHIIRAIEAKALANGKQRETPGFVALQVAKEAKRLRRAEQDANGQQSKDTPPRVPPKTQPPATPAEPPPSVESQSPPDPAPDR